jgi:hypothetical protein
MTEAILHPIQRIAPQPGYRLLVHWREGGHTVVDFSDDVANGPVREPPRDERLFARVRLARRGRVIAWPEPRHPNGWPTVDVDADGLWYIAQTQNAAIAAECVRGGGAVRAIVTYRWGWLRGRI